MKKIVALMLVITVFTFSSNAKEIKGISLLVSTNFYDTFCNAENVKWQTNNDIVKANFDYEGESCTAYYLKDGSYMGLSTSVALDKLPSNAIRNFTKNYPFPYFNLTDCIKVISPDGEINYYISFQEASNNKRRIIRVSEMGGVYTFHE